MPDPSQFNTDRTCPGLSTITFSNAPINMFVPTTIVELGALMTDLEPTAAELQSSNDMFFSTLARPGAQARRAKVRSIGYGVRSDFELNFGRYLPALGRADDDDTDTQPD